MKIRFEWFYNKKSNCWQLTTPNISLFYSWSESSKGGCLAFNLIFITVELWFGSKEYLKEI